MYGNGKSYLVETGTFRTNLRDGMQKEPKFELDSLEIKVQSVIERNQTFFYRLSHQAEDQTISVGKVTLHSQRDKTLKADYEMRNPKGRCTKN